jgi:C-terminal processing protease CtpA/Prc
MRFWILLFLFGAAGLRGDEVAPGEEGHNMAGIGIVAAADAPIIRGARSPQLHDHITVRRVVSDGPAMKVGLLAGDEIVEVNGEKLAGVRFVDAIVNLIRGPLGTPVKLTVLRSGQRLSFVVVRDIIPVEEK